MPYIQLAMFVVSMLYSAYSANKAAKAAAKSASVDPADWSSAEWPTADEGTPQAMIFGDCWSEDWFVLAVGNKRARPIQTDSADKK